VDEALRASNHAIARIQQLVAPESCNNRAIA